MNLSFHNKKLGGEAPPPQLTMGATPMLCLYIYVTLLTQRCKGNDTQADKSQNHCTYIVQNVLRTLYMYTVHYCSYM